MAKVKKSEKLEAEQKAKIGVIGAKDEVRVKLKCNYGDKKPNDLVNIHKDFAEELYKMGFIDYV